MDTIILYSYLYIYGICSLIIYYPSLTLRYIILSSSIQMVNRSSSDRRPLSVCVLQFITAHRYSCWLSLHLTAIHASVFSILLLLCALFYNVANIIILYYYIHFLVFVNLVTAVLWNVVLLVLRRSMRLLSDT